MEEAIEQPQDASTNVEATPSPEPQLSPGPIKETPLSELLSQFETATQPSPELTQAAEQTPQQARDEGLKWLDEMLGPAPTDPALLAAQNEAAQLRATIHAEKEQKDFSEYSAKLQAELPDYLPDDYARTQLLAMAAGPGGQQLIQAWDARHANTSQVRAEMLQIDKQLAVYRFNPRAAVGQEQQIKQLFDYRARLEVALAAPRVLQKAWREVIERGKAVPGPIDPEATADRNAVAAAVRGSSGAVPADRPPRFGIMGTNEYRTAVRDRYGFDPMK